jgi:N-acetylglucosaminyldiphosphoundecaprenol N-acetyl-beta-D-mannosaminyltransferase
MNKENFIIEQKLILTDLNIKNWCNGCVCTFLNPVSYLEAVKEEELFGKFDLIFADGSIMVWFIHLLYGKKIKRRSFDMTSMAKEVFQYASNEKKTVYFVGASEANLKIAIDKIKKDFPFLEIVGSRNGFFSSKDDLKLEIDNIIEKSPDLLIVGMGVIKQEKFLLQVKDAGFSGCGFTCGGFLHQYAMRGKKYYPDWINKYNLRFLYRMCKEPYTIRRYAKAFFMFPVLVLKRKYF